MKDINIERMLEWFEIKGNKLIGEEKIKTLSLDDLKEIFNVEDEKIFNDNMSYNETFDPYMFYEYKIKIEHLNVLQPHFEHNIDLNKYSYFISSYSKD